MKANPLRDVVRLLAYTVSATAMLTLYLIVPLMIVFGSTFRQSWSELLAALGTLALLEVPVVAILVKTCSPPEEAVRSRKRSEKRKAVRVPTGFWVEIRGARAAKDSPQFSLTGWAINASRGGLAVLVSPERRLHPPSYVSLRAELPQGTTVEAKARVVSLEEVPEESRASQLLRLELVAMDYQHQHTYLHYIADLEKSIQAA